MEEIDNTDWKEILMHVLEGLADCEGYWFEKSWKLPEETIKMIEEEFDKWIDKNKT